MHRLLASLGVLCVARAAPAPVFSKDVLPILQHRCQTCHRPGEIAPMPLLTYAEARPWARAIREVVLRRNMPPWSADSQYGHFSNDPSLSAEEISTLAAWVESGAKEGDPKDAPPARIWPDGWNIGAPDVVFQAAKPIQIPASGTIEYQYTILATHFSEDRWIQSVEVRPSDRAAVHHAVVYIREPGSKWLEGEPRGVAFSLPATMGHHPNQKSFTTSDVLLVYTPGNSFDTWKPGMAKKIKAGSDIVLQMHYTAHGKASLDQTRAALVFAKAPPQKAVLTLQMGNDSFDIPPGDPNYRVQVSGTLPNDALLLSLFPHMHLRGKAFEYQIANPDGRIETLLKVSRFNFNWQFDYKLVEPRLLRAGTRLVCIGYFDNSANNPANPDPTADVRFGEQSWDEMMIGFFDVAVDASVDKPKFFERSR